MERIYLKRCLALLLPLLFPLLMAGCGSGSSSASSASNPDGAPPANSPGAGSSTPSTIGGTVTGLPATNSILLMNNNQDIINVAGGSHFSFDKTVNAGAPYTVTVFGQPDGYGCVVANGSGTVDANGDAVTDISVACQSAAATGVYAYVGVTVSGLAAGGTATFLLNGGDTLTVSADGLAVFSQAVYLEQLNPQGPGSYVVTIGTNPAGQTCTLANASGTIDQQPVKDFVNVVVTCT